MPFRVLALCAATDASIQRSLDMHLADLKTRGSITLRFATERLAEDARTAVSDADLLLVLLTPALIASPIWRGALMQAARAIRDEGRLITVPVLVEECEWRESWLASIKGVPDNGRPISTSRDSTAAWAEVTRAVRAIAARRSAPAPSPSREAGLATSGAAVPPVEVARPAAGSGSSSRASGGRIDPETLRAAYRYITAHHHRVYRLIDETERVIRRVLGERIESSIEPYVLRRPDLHAPASPAGARELIPLQNSSFLWMTASAISKQACRVVVVHEGDSGSRHAGVHSAAEATSTLSAQVTSVWLIEEAQTPVAWSQVDTWIGRASGFSASQWEDGTIHASVRPEAAIRFGGLARPLGTFNLDSPSASWLEPLGALLASAHRR